MKCAQSCQSTHIMVLGSGGCPGGLSTEPVCCAHAATRESPYTEHGQHSPAADAASDFPGFVVLSEYTE